MKLAGSATASVASIGTVTALVGAVASTVAVLVVRSSRVVISGAGT
jgi:hypothetical protein